MQESERPMGAPLSAIPRRRRRQKRTVYSAEQRQELEQVFESNQYPTYQERETLAATLNLQEHQVQVWFKNRRAKHSRLLGLSRCQGPEARAGPQDPRACAPVPAPVSPVFPGAPVFPEGPGFCKPPPPSPFGVFPAAEPNVSSHSQAWWDPAQGAQKMVPAAPAPAPAPAPVPAPAPDPAPAPAPVLPQGPYSSDFSLDPVLIHGFTELPSLQDLLEEPSSSSMSGYQEGDDNDWDPRTLLDL